jgi:hypothetical protein
MSKLSASNQAFRFPIHQLNGKLNHMEPLAKFPSAEGHSGGSGILIRRRCLAMQSHAIEATWGGDRHEDSIFRARRDLAWPVSVSDFD